MTHHHHTTAKPKRLPQRGLGVAQLEKIRLQEHRAAASRLNLPDRPGFAFWPHPAFSQFQNSPVVSASPGMCPQIEPPSNQNPHTEEHRMVGMKRSYPISVESPPLPSFVATFQHPTLPAAVSVLRSDELLHPSNCRYTRTKHIRSDFPSDNKKLILTLAPPTTAISPKSNSDSDSENNNLNLSHSSGCSSSMQPLNLFPVESETSKTTSDESHDAGDGVKGDSIDLNLKL